MRRFMQERMRRTRMITGRRPLPPTQKLWNRMILCGIRFTTGSSKRNYGRTIDGDAYTDADAEIYSDDECAICCEFNILLRLTA